MSPYKVYVKSPLLDIEHKLYAYEDIYGNFLLSYKTLKILFHLLRAEAGMLYQVD